MSAAMVVIKWHFHVKNSLILQRHQADYSKEIRPAIMDTLATLSQIEELWSKYTKLKEEHIRQLQSQNIQQTRSMDRLSAALKKCS